METTPNISSSAPSLQPIKVTLTVKLSAGAGGVFPHKLSERNIDLNLNLNSVISSNAILTNYCYVHRSAHLTPSWSGILHLQTLGSK